MDFKQIQELIKIVNKSSIGELCIEEGDFKITIKQKEEPTPIYSTAAPVQSYIPAPPPQLTAPAPPAAPQTSQSAPAAPEAPVRQSENVITIKSPMIGTFYRSAGPDKPAFVNVGDEVSVGKTVCIIEAMKLFNEIESEVKGTIVKVLVEDASPVEYDQPLFLVEP
jgi:acetyl-CoA carboxylase biotin carboxyl carrier protein